MPLASGRHGQAVSVQADAAHHEPVGVHRIERRLEDRLEVSGFRHAGVFPNPRDRFATAPSAPRDDAAGGFPYFKIRPSLTSRAWTPPVSRPSAVAMDLMLSPRLWRASASASSSAVHFLKALAGLALTAGRGVGCAGAAPLISLTKAD